MRFPHTLSIALVIASLVAVRPQPLLADDGGQQYRFAKGLYARQQWDAAAEELQGFLQQHPDHPQAAQAQFYLGEALVQQGRFQEACRQFENYLQVRPDGEFRRQSLFRVAECDFLANQQGNASQRLAGFSEAYPDDPLNGLVLSYRGTIALRQDLPSEAEALFRQSLNRFPDARSQDSCRMGLARALEALGKADDAQRFYLALAAKTQSPMAIEAKYRLGALQYAQREYASALDSFTELDSIPDPDPWAANARLGKGWALVKLDRHQDAVHVFQQLVEHPRVAVQARYWLGLCRKAEGNWAAAAQAFLAAADRLEQERTRPDGQRTAGDVTEAAIFFHAGDSLLAAGDLKAARKHFDRAVASGREGDFWLDDAHRAAVQTSLRLKDYERGRRDAERFLAKRLDSRVAPDLLRLLVRIELEQQEFVDAERTLCLLDELTLGSPKVLEEDYLLALAYQGQRRFEESLRLLRPVIAQDQGSLGVDARLAEASVLVAMNRFDDALTALSEYLATGDASLNRCQAFALSAVCHARLGRGDEAQRLYEQAFGDAGEPTTLRWDTAEQIAEAALAAKEYIRAEAAFRDLIDGVGDGDRKDRALVGLAWSQHARSEDESADATLAELSKTSPDAALSAEAEFLRGQVLRGLGRLDAACRAFEQVAHEHADSSYRADALWEAAQLHEQLERLEPAAALYQAIVDLGPAHAHNAGALYSLAWIRQQQGAADDAAALFRRVVAEHRGSPYWAHAVLSAGQHQLDAARYSEATATVDELLAAEASGPVRDRALYLAGQIAFASGHWLQARQRFDQLLGECAESELVKDAAYGAAEAAFRDKDPQACERFSQLLNETAGLSDTTRATTRMRLAQLHAEAGRWDDAQVAAEAFTAEFPGFPQHYEVDYVLGRCFAARAQFAEAREAYQKVIASPNGEKTETAAKAQLMIAESYFHQRRYYDAYRGYMQVEILYDYPELQAAALLQAGKCRQLMKEDEAAASLYRQLIESYPGTDAAEQAVSLLNPGRR